MARKLLSLFAVGAVVAVAWLVHVSSRPRPLQTEPTADASDDVEPVKSALPDENRKSVNRALDFLVEKQFDDGHWEGDDGSRPVALTGLAGLAMIMHESNPEIDYDHRWSRRVIASGVLQQRAEQKDSLLEAIQKAEQAVKRAKYFANIRKAADWLMAHADPERGGLIFTGHPSETGDYIRSHGLAMIFLSGVLQVEYQPDRRKRLQTVLMRAAKYLEKSQSTQGGWHDTSKLEGHDLDSMLPTAIVVHALQAARNTDIPVRYETMEDAKALMAKWCQIDMTKAMLSPNARISRNQLVDACALLPDFFPWTPWRETNMVSDGCRENLMAFLSSRIPLGDELQFGRDEWLHYYYAQAAFTEAKDRWTSYRANTFEYLQREQLADGGWPSRDGASVGSVFSTAVFGTVMQLENRRHPSKPLKKRIQE